MKIKPEHYKDLKDCISLIKDQIEPRRQFIKNEGKAKDVEKRLRWDLLYMAVSTRWICDVLYEYLNDDHLDTALKQILLELGVPRG